MPSLIPATRPSAIRADVALLTASLKAFALMNTSPLEVTIKTIENVARLYPHSHAPTATEQMHQIVDHILHSLDRTRPIDSPFLPSTTNMVRHYHEHAVVQILIYLCAIPSYFSHDREARALIGL